MTHSIENVKRTSQLKFDDVITGNTLSAKYTHHREGKPMFIVGSGVKGTDCFWVTGLKNLRKNLVD